MSPLGWVGSGFESRAAFLEGALKAILDDRLLDVKGQPTRKLRVIVAGHSLGAVVTELVAYDINEYLKAQNALYPGLAMNQSRYSVLAYTFNAPMVGPHATVVNYRQVLAASVDEPVARILSFGKASAPILSTRAGSCGRPRSLLLFCLFVRSSSTADALTRIVRVPFAICSCSRVQLRLRPESVRLRLLH